MPRTVHTAPHAQQPLGGNEVVDLPPLEPGLDQLPAGDEPVLAIREPLNQLKWSGFPANRGETPLHPTIVTPPASPNNAQQQQDRHKTPPPHPAGRSNATRR
jgi:hypothetical protein